MEKLQKAGVEQFVVVVGYRQEQVRNALAGIENVEFIEQTGNGTRGALLSALEFINDDRFLVLYGDVVLTFDDIA